MSGRHSGLVYSSIQSARAESESGQGKEARRYQKLAVARLATADGTEVSRIGLHEEERRRAFRFADDERRLVVVTHYEGLPTRMDETANAEMLIRRPAILLDDLLRERASPR